VTIDADSIDISSGSVISSQASKADAGQIHITANRLILNNVSISSNTVSSGRGGNVVLNVGTVSLLNGAKINSSTSEAGRAGDITMNVGTLSLAKSSSISSASTGAEVITNPDDGTTQAPGAAGNVVITATGSFTSDASTIATSAEANRGGDISITAGNIRFSNGTLINANSNGPLTVTRLVLDANGQLVEQVVGDGNAGNIRIESSTTVVMEQSSVTTKATQASGGQITINAPNMIRLIDSPISTSVEGAAGDSNGGNISIDPDFVILRNSPILARAVAGSGGAIGITAGLFLADPSSIVDASSTLGVSGTVQINAPINNLSSVVARLPESLLAVQALLRASCAAKLAQGSTSSFVERGRDGIPTGPDGLLASPYLPMIAEHSKQRQPAPSTRISGIQLRRLFRQEMPASVTLISDRGGCSS
jgi:large exoprotein involved in heme utilization and adhesion